MMTPDPDMNGWTLEVEVPEGAAPAFMRALDGLAAGVSGFATTDGGPWRIAAWFTDMPDRGALAAAIALAAAAAGAPEPDFVVRPLEMRDWLAENRASFGPLSAGRFFVHPSHYRGAPPAGSLAIALDAATAFGSGEHGTTRGCLLALDALARRRRPRRVLDMGCGSGILSIAAARLWPVRVLAVDIDAEAVRIARGNARRNGVAQRVCGVCGDGFAGLPRSRGGRFDLIVANILARPLQRLARDLARHLAPGGTAILSGLLAAQEAAVLAAYRAQGLKLARRLRIDGWSTLVLGRRQSSQYQRLAEGVRVQNRKLPAAKKTR